MKLPDDISNAAENIHDGWYSDNSRIDWDDFIDRLEDHTGVDFGSDMMSPTIQSVKRHIRAYRNLES